jgi:hypothetical protein
MMGLSFSKLVFTILIVIAVWRAYKVLGPFLARMQGATPRPQPRPRAARQREPAQAVELVACPHCGTFVPRGIFCPSREHCRLQQGGRTAA